MPAIHGHETAAMLEAYDFSAIQMGLTGPHFLGNSDGLDHYSFRIRFRTRMERPTVADSGFGMAPVRIRPPSTR